MSAIPDMKMLCRDQFCVGTTGLCRPKVPTFGCRADMSPKSVTFPAKPAVQCCLPSGISSLMAPSPPRDKQRNMVKGRVQEGN
jgi:hypothetical protein